MFKNLSPAALGITGRQSEIIELALTYGFRGFDLNMAEFAKRSQSRGAEHARRFIDSAKIRIGEFELPLSWRGPETTYKADLVQLPALAETAASVGAVRCYANVLPFSEELPYHENFELHRHRLAEIGAILARNEIRLGLNLLTAPARREGRRHEFIHQVEPFLLLVKSINAPNVGIVLDNWNWHFGGGGFDQLSELNAQQIVAVRLADAPDSVDPTAPDDRKRILPGKGGSLDCVKVMSTLVAIEYKGPVTPTPHPSCFTGMTRDGIVQQAAESLEEQYRGAGLGKAGKQAAPADA